MKDENDINVQNILQSGFRFPFPNPVSKILLLEKHKPEEEEDDKQIIKDVSILLFYRTKSLLSLLFFKMPSFWSSMVSLSLLEPTYK